MRKYQEEICIYCLHFIYKNHNILEAVCSHDYDIIYNNNEVKEVIYKKVKPYDICNIDNFSRAMGQTIRANIMDLERCCRCSKIISRGERYAYRFKERLCVCIKCNDKSG